MSAGFLLDTNVLSETRKARPDRSVVAFLRSMPASKLFVSALTIGELHKGIKAKSLGDKAAADRLFRWVLVLEEDFRDRTLPIDVTVACLWGELSGLWSRPVVDMLIAATALARGLTLVTRNVRDFENLDLPLLDPWAGVHPPQD